MGRGKYIVIEGHDGTGKSTQVGLIREKLAADGINSIEFHEPQGSPIADEIRTVIKNGALERDGPERAALRAAIGRSRRLNCVWRSQRNRECSRPRDSGRLAGASLASSGSVDGS